MKLLLFSFLSVSIFFFSFADTHTWDGSLSGDWSVDANWVEGTAPADGDDIVFDAGSNDANAPILLGPITIGSLTFTAIDGNIVLNLAGFDLTINGDLIGDNDYTFEFNNSSAALNSFVIFGSTSSKIDINGATIAACSCGFGKSMTFQVNTTNNNDSIYFDSDATFVDDFEVIKGNLKIRKSGVDVDFSGDLDVTAVNGKVILSNGTIDVTGNINVSNGNFNVLGVGTLRVEGASSSDINVSGGTLLLNASTEAGGKISVADQLNVSSGTFTLTEGTIELGTNTSSSSNAKLNLTGGNVNLTDGKIDIKSSNSSTVSLVNDNATPTVTPNKNCTLWITVSDQAWALGDPQMLFPSVNINTPSQDGDVVATLDIDGNLIITDASDFDLVDETINLKNNFTWTAGTIDFNTNASSTFVFDGGADQTFTKGGGTGNLIFENLTINQSSGGNSVTMNCDIYIEGTLTLTTGYLTSASSETIYMEGDAPSDFSFTANDDDSYIDAEVILEGAIDWGRVPVGDDGQIAEVDIDNTSGNANDQIHLKYYTWNLPMFFLSGYYTYGANVTSVSQMEHWEIWEPINASSTPNTIFTWDAGRSASTANFTDHTETNVVYLEADGTTWNRVSAPTTHTGNTTSGSVDAPSLPLQSGARKYSLGIDGSSTLLPIELINYTGKFNSTKNCNELNWSTASEKDVDIFIIEKIDPNYNVTKTFKVDATGNSNFLQNYHLEDFEIGQDYTYNLYELDVDGNTTYLESVTIESNSPSTIQYTLNEGNISLQGTDEQAYTGHIYNLNGQKVLTFRNSMNISFLPEGYYIIVADGLREKFKL